MVDKSKIIHIKDENLRILYLIFQFYEPEIIGALSDLFSLAVLSGNAAWLCSLVARERSEKH
jgi:hypothetical protein